MGAIYSTAMYLNALTIREGDPGPGLYYIYFEGGKHLQHQEERLQSKEHAEMKAIEYGLKIEASKVYVYFIENIEIVHGVGCYAMRNVSTIELDKMIPEEISKKLNKN